MKITQTYVNLKSLGEEINLPLLQLLGISIALHLLTCYASVGFYQPDEHFQILEFVNYKMGLSDAAELPWEFHEQIRPSLQPALAILFFNSLQWLGIDNPFTWNLLLKIFTSFFAFGSILALAFYSSSQLQSKGSKRVLWLSSLFLWFMPYLHIRFTGENISGILFILAVLLLLRFDGSERSENRWWVEVLAAALLGFAFYLRFQMGFALLGLGLWLLLVQRRRWASIGWLVMGFSGAIACNILIDFWFYGEWVVSPYNYFYANIVEDKASGFGVSPWYAYFSSFLLGSAPPLSILLFLLFGVGAWRLRKSIWVWSFLPFLLAHMAVGHKELRFLFPALYFFPLLLAAGGDSFRQYYSRAKWQRYLFYFLGVQNVFLLLLFAFPPIHRLMDYNEYFMKALYEVVEDNEKETLLLSRQGSPYNTLKLMMNFYAHPRLQWQSFESEEELMEWLNSQQGQGNWLWYQEGFEEPEAVRGFRFQSEYKMFPDWFQQYNPYDWQEKVPIKNLYRIRKDQ